jgi:hypothetical protein
MPQRCRARCMSNCKCHDLHLCSSVFAANEIRFCPAALSQPPAVLAERAHLLAAECRRVEAEADQSREMAISSLEKIGASPLVDVHLKGDEVQLLSTMTLIYRAIPAPEGSPTRFCQECIDTARKASRKHFACMDLVRKDPHARAIYVHW